MVCDRENEYVPAPQFISEGNEKEAMQIVSSNMTSTDEDHIHHCLRSRCFRFLRISFAWATQASGGGPSGVFDECASSMVDGI
jgi:hypothetical protein